jgi:sugar lactone lactonase YvrE
MPISHAPSISDLEPWGRDLHRPECVVATAMGDVFVSDWRGGVTLVRGDSSQQAWLAPGSAGLRPNGIAVDRDEGFVIANLADAGGVWRLDRTGALEPLITEVDGVAMPPTNFAAMDARGRLWVSVSTRHHPRQLAWRPEVADGFVVLLDERGARIVADGLHYTNEVRVGPDGSSLYIVETFGRRLVRCAMSEDGRLGARETVVQFERGVFPDGFEFDAEGGIWITSLVSNRVLRFDGRDVHTMIEDLNPDYVNAVEAAFAEGRMETQHLGPIPGTTLQHATSIAFGGADGRTGYIGGLHTTCIYRFRSTL